MMRKVAIFAGPVLLMMTFCHAALGQAAASTLKVELRNVVEYQVDTSDLSKYGTNTGLTVGASPRQGV